MMDGDARKATAEMPHEHDLHDLVRAHHRRSF
jgi:hypothetical protein